jgi:hypothetical protein
MNRPSVSLPLLLVVIAVLVIAYVVRARHHHQSSPAAQAMTAGKARSAAALGQETGATDLSDDDQAAGVLWARAHPGQRLPDGPAGVRQGLLAGRLASSGWLPSLRINADKNVKDVDRDCG